MPEEIRLLQEPQLHQRKFDFYRSCNCVKGFCFTCLPRASAVHICRVHLSRASVVHICRVHLPRASVACVRHIFGSNASLCSRKSNSATFSSLMYKIFQIIESKLEIATFLSLISNSKIKIRHILASYAQT